MGGGGKGSSSSKSAPPKEIMEAYKKSIGYAGQAISKPYEQYQGQLVAGLNPTQLQGIANVNAAQGAALPYIQQGAGIVGQAAQGVTPGMINQFMSPYLNTVVGATQRNLLESNAQQQNALKSQAIQSGAFGGDRARVGQAELARQQGLAGGQVIGGLMNQGFNTALTGAQQNIQSMIQGGQALGGLGMSAQQSILQGAQAQLAAGAQQQATDQAFLQSAYDQFLQRQAFPFQQAQFYANIAQGIGAGAGGTTTQQAAAPNPLSQIFGGLTAIGSIFPSDERLKENIEPIGKTFDGQNIYKYNFKDEPGRKRIGLMAQEVEEKHPDAVKSLGGIKMVDYDEATEEAAQRHGKALGGSSMGGLVTPSMQREAFAQGGFGGVPYADFFKGMAYVPTGELTYRGQSPGSTFPKGFSAEELEKIAEGSSFDEINAMSEKDIKNFQAGLGKVGTSLGLSPVSNGADGARAPAYSGPLASFGPSVSSFFSGIGNALGFAEGGVVPRHGYATDGSVDEESPLPPFLVTAESGGDLAADNEKGYVGRGQFGEARLTDAKRAGVIPPDLTQEQFKNNPDLQRAVEQWHVQDVNKYIENRGLGAFVGKEINGVPVTEQGLLAVAHLGGKGGMEKFLKSGGRYNPKDANGTSLMDYLALAANADSGVVPETPPANVSETPAPGVVPAPVADVSTVPAEPTGRRRNLIESLIGQDLSDQARTGVLAAGLAMLGGRSPYFGVNVGKGALAGLNAYYTGLTNQRELAKTQAELGLRKTEAETGRMQAETARMELNMKWMPYAISALAWQANPANAGLDMPPLYRKALEMLQNGDISLPGNQPAPDTSKFGPRVEPTAGQPAPAPGPTPLNAAPEQPETDAEIAKLVAPQQTSEEAPQAAPSGNAPPIKTAADVPATTASLFDEHFGPTNKFNPMYHLRYADALTAYGLTEQANAERKIGMDDLNTFITNNGFFSPRDNKFIMLPGSTEAKSKLAEAEKLGAGEGEQKTDYYKRMSGFMDNYATQVNGLNQAAEILQNFESGALASTKGDIAAYFSAIGIPVSDKQLADASNAQQLTKIVVGGLLDSGLRQKFGTVAVGELELAMKSVGNPDLQPSANRSIIGTMRGVTEWQYAMAQDLQNWLDQKGGLANVTMREIRQWQADNWDNKLADYIKNSKANMPVAGELKVTSSGGLQLTNGQRPKDGYKYMLPNSDTIVQWNGTQFVEVQ